MDSPRRCDQRPSDDHWLWGDDLDGVVAAPDSHRVLLENSRVRVLEVVVGTGAREPVHTHRWASVMIVTHPARIRYHAGDKPAVDISPPTGSASGPKTEWLAPEGPHAIENLDGHDYRALRIELR